MTIAKPQLDVQPLVIGVDPSTPVWRIWKLMKQQKRKFLPVIVGGQLQGVVKGADVAMLTALNPGNLDLSDVMDTSPFCISLPEPLSDLIGRLTSSHCEYAVLMDEAANVLDIVNVNEVLKYINLFPQSSNDSMVEQLFLWRQKNGNYR